MNIIGNIKFNKEGIYRVDGDNIILGKNRMIIINNFSYHLTNIGIYADGMIDCWGLISLAEFERKLNSGWILRGVPEGKEVDVFMLGRFRSVSPSNYIDRNEFLKEVRDTINLLSGRPTTLQICRDTYDTYNAIPTDTNKEALRKAYEAMPEHMRHYVLGDMELKDHPIRDILDQNDSDHRTEDKDGRFIKEFLLKESKHYPRLSRMIKANSSSIIEQIISISKKWHEGDIVSAIQSLESDLGH